MELGRRSVLLIFSFVLLSVIGQAFAQEQSLSDLVRSIGQTILNGEPYGVDLFIQNDNPPAALTEPWKGNSDSLSAAITPTLFYRNALDKNHLKAPFSVSLQLEEGHYIVRSELIAERYPGGVIVKQETEPRVIHIEGNQGRELFLLVPVSQDSKISRALGICIHQRDLDRSAFRSKGEEAPALESFTPLVSHVHFNAEGAVSGGITTGLSPGRALVSFVVNEYLPPASPADDESFKRYPSARLNYKAEYASKEFLFDQRTTAFIEGKVLLHSGPGYLRESTLRSSLSVESTSLEPYIAELKERYGFLRRPGASSCVMVVASWQLSRRYEHVQLKESTE
jgi:hypothetical protein